MKDIILKIENLTYSYEENKKVLDGISLEIFQGEKVAVLGNNGSGKTTFFKNINGVYIPDSGEIFFKGRKIEKNKKDINFLRKNIGIVFQNSDSQIIGTTVFDELAFGLLNIGEENSKVEKKVVEIGKKFNLEKYLKTPPHYLSGGEKKRLTIADIVVMEPEIIIFDEPTSELDQKSIKELEITLEELNSEGKTLIISTHDIDFAYKFADRIIIFSDGKVIASDIPENIFKNQEILQKLYLRKPILFEISEELQSRGLLNKDEFPKTMKEIKNILGGKNENR
ncbi:energy-coupling factor ABC transporter ATP-binding protein [Fusobacterium perfoetens]|uniref:energy-coupling factor ABC transporter ATP-binding protein n=1 Tax=Fusobacterium perfoetens TaxID=852 RepID=UPI000485E08D|nr:ABC transporter ATP-binding protein [Fusobacterium perfoetens]